MSTERRKRIEVICLTYGEPAQPKWRPQFEYSHSILNRLTRRVAPIPKFVTPLLAARRGRIRKNTMLETGYRSPLDEITRRQVVALDARLRGMRPDCDFNVTAIFEFCHPYLLDYLPRLRQNPPDELILVPLYLAEGDFTSGVSRTDMAAFHRATKGTHGLPKPKYLTAFGFDPKLGKILADFVWGHCVRAGWSEEKCAQSALIMGAHGTIVYPPPGLNNGGKETCHAYGMIRSHLKDKFRRVRIGWLNHTIGGKWTEPEVAESAREVHELGIRNVVYYPFGFLGDNGESQVEGRAALDQYQWDDLLYLPCPNDDPSFIAYIADKVVERMARPGEAWDTIEAGDESLKKRERYVPKGEPGPLKFNGPTLAVIACLFWLGVGTMLVKRGVGYASHVESANTLAVVIACALAIGLWKGTRILGALAKKNLVRLRRIAQPSPLHHLFSKATWCVIGFFMAVGIAIRHSPLPDSVRAAIVLGVGLSLFVGGVYYVLHYRLVKPLAAKSAAPRTDTVAAGTSG